MVNPMSIYYKATKLDLTSIGLNRAGIVQYKLGGWVYPDKVSSSPIRDGLWVGKNKGFINWLRGYNLKKYNRKIRIFECEIGNVLYETSNRIKTDRVKLLSETRQI